MLLQKKPWWGNFSVSSPQVLTSLNKAELNQNQCRFLLLYFKDREEGNNIFFRSDTPCEKDGSSVPFSSHAIDRLSTAATPAAATPTNSNAYARSTEEYPITRTHPDAIVHQSYLQKRVLWKLSFWGVGKYLFSRPFLPVRGIFTEHISRVSRQQGIWDWRAMGKQWVRDHHSLFHSGHVTKKITPALVINYASCSEAAVTDFGPRGQRPAWMFAL